MRARSLDCSIPAKFQIRPTWPLWDNVLPLGVYPPIAKMDGPFHQLIECEKFSLSTNMITNIANLSAFKKLKILSLGRNNIRSLQGNSQFWTECDTPLFSGLSPIGTSYLPKFQKRAVTNLKNYLTKSDENLRKPKVGP